jgi:hypothetical protein
MTMITDYQQALVYIRRLDRVSKARLIAEVAQELAVEPTEKAQTARDPRVVLAEIREHFAALGPVSPSVGEQLELDRQSRADFLEGKVRDSDVHA